MPHFAPQQIRQRGVIDSSQSANVQLTPQANLSVASAAGSPMFAIADALNRAQGVGTDFLLTKQAQQDQQSLTKGKAQALQDQADGGKAALAAGASTNEQNPDAAYRKGYEETAGILQAQNWGLQVAQEADNLDPNDTQGFEKLLQQRTHEALQETDPRYRQALLPALTRMQAQIRAQFADRAAKENKQAATDNLNQLVQNGILDGSLNDPKALDMFYQYAGKPEFGNLTRREIDENVILPAAMQALSSGKVDPSTFIATLSKRHADGTPGLMSKFGADLERAAHQGAEIRKQALTEQQARAETQFTFTLYDMAKRGQLTRAFLTAKAKEFGHDDDRNWALMWMLKQEEYAKEAAAKRKKATDEDTILLALSNPKFSNLLTTFTPDQVSGVINKQMRAGMAAEDMGDPRGTSTITHWAAVARDKGYVVDAVKNQFALFDPKKVNQAAGMFKLYQQLQSVDPAWAARHLDAPTAAYMDRIGQHVDELRQTPEQAIGALEVSPLTQDDSRKAVNHAWAKFQYSLPSVTNQPAFNKRVMDNAVEMYATGNYNKPEDAIAAAVKYTQDNSMMIDGRAVPNLGYGPHAPDAVKAVLDHIKTKLTDGKAITKDTQLGVVADPGNGGQLLVIDQTPGPSYGYPIMKDGKRVYLDPHALSNAYGDYKTQLAAKETEAAQKARAEALKGVRYTTATDPRSGLTYPTSNDTMLRELNAKLKAHSASNAVDEKSSFIDFLSTYKQ